MSETESIQSIDTLSVEESLIALRDHSVAVETLFEQIQDHFKQFRKLMVETPMDSLSEINLQAKEQLKPWLTQRLLPTSLSFQEFFAVFLKEHAKEHRLDLSRRSIHLNPDAVALLQYNSNDPISILDFLLFIPVLFE